MPRSKQQSITRIESEYGEPIEKVFKGFAISNSYTFTCKILQIGYQTFEEYKPLFTQRYQPARTEKNIGVAKSNRDRAKLYGGKTLKQWTDETGTPRSTIVHRIKVLGWTPERAARTPAMNTGNSAHFNKPRVRENRKRLKKMWFG